jgi:hypothetical protein
MFLMVNLVKIWYNNTNNNKLTWNKYLNLQKCCLHSLTWSIYTKRPVLTRHHYHIYIYIYNLYIHMYIYMYIYYIYTYLCIYMYIHIFIYIYIFIYILVSLVWAKYVLWPMYIYAQGAVITGVWVLAPNTYLRILTP